jgi:hypothetical protein
MNAAATLKIIRSMFVINGLGPLSILDKLKLSVFFNVPFFIVV